MNTSLNQAVQKVETLLLPDFLPELLDAGIDITMSRHPEHGVCFDLNLQAKSPLWLYSKEGKWRVAMRYGENFPVDDLHGLLSAAVHGMHGRTYINTAWKNLLHKHGRTLPT